MVQESSITHVVINQLLMWHPVLKYGVLQKFVKKGSVLAFCSVFIADKVIKSSLTS